MESLQSHPRIELFLVLAAMSAAAISPNLFVVAQAGYAKLSILALTFLIPSLIAVALVLGIAMFLRLNGLRRQILTGILGGFLATAALEVIRETGYHLGGMPGDMPKLLGVLLLDRFALGPSWLSNLAGWGYHFWNGAAFGIIYSLTFSRTRWWAGLIYALVIALIFMSSPAVVAMGVGRFGVEFGPGFATTVLVAHMAYGAVLGWAASRYNVGTLNLWTRLRLVVKGELGVSSNQHA